MSIKIEDGYEDYACENCGKIAAIWVGIGAAGTNVKTQATLCRRCAGKLAEKLDQYLTRTAFTKGGD